MEFRFLTKSVLVLLLSIMGMFACKEAEPALPRDYVALYKFENNGLDESKFQQHGLLNKVQFTKGVKGFAAKFIAKDKTYMKIAFPPQLNFAQNSNFSIHFFVKFGLQTDLNVRDNYLVSMWHPAKNYPWALRIVNQTDLKSPLTFYFARYDACTNDPVLTSATPIGDNKFHSVCVVKNETRLILYLDGSQVSEVVDRTKCSTQNESPIYIGCEHPDQRYAWSDFELDELCFFDRTLSAKEVQTLAAQK